MSVISRLKRAGFEVYAREEWGTARPGAYAERAANPYYKVAEPAPFHFLHITVTPDTDTKLEGFAGARKVEGYGLSTPPMVSYQMLVTNEAKAFEGQNYGVKGTHTVNDKGVPGFPHDLNRYGYAVALMQNVGDEVTDAQVVLLAATFAAAELEGHVKKYAVIYPHRKFDWKSCPGDKAVRRLGEIQQLKDSYVRAGKLPGERRVLLPVIRLRPLVRQARLSPELRTPNRRDVRLVQRALNRKLNANLSVDGLWKGRDRAAYAAWQRHLGYSGTDANGVPGRVSLRRLGRGQFRVL